MPMIRKYCHALAAAVALACLAAPAAMATDEPPPPAPTSPAPTSTAPVAPAVTPAACTDKTAPSSKLATTSRSALRTRVLRGKSVDLGCGVGGSGSAARGNPRAGLTHG